MTSERYRHPLRYRRLLPFLCFLVLALISGCATQKSMVVLLPEQGRPSGEVTIETAQGTQVLNQSWQSVQIAGPRGKPSAPTVVEPSQVESSFAKVIATLPLQPVQFLLYFKFASTELVPDSQLLLPEIVRAIKERRPARVTVIGHTDTLGSGDYNVLLGLARAREVLELLTAQGVPATEVDIASHGKSELAVPTADQTPEPRNRRAVVRIR